MEGFLMKECVLTEKEAMDKAEKILSGAKAVFLATNGSHGHPNLRALAPIGREGLSTVWFAVNAQSCKIAELMCDSKAVVYGYAPRTLAEFRMWGNAAILDDEESKERFWCDEFEEYFTGKDDPDLRILRFDAISGVYADKSGKGGMFKI